MGDGKREYEDKALFPPVSPMEAGLKCACPRCGEGRLYDGILNPGKQCMSCGLDYGFIDSGDGPAVFVILIIGFVIVAMAMALQSTLNPPYWVHIILWGPLICIMSIVGLRISKAMLIAWQYQTRAEQGTLDQDND